MICQLCFEEEAVQDENLCEKCIKSCNEDMDLSLDSIINELDK